MSSIPYKRIRVGHTSFMREDLKKPLLEVVRILGITLAVYVIMRFLLPLVLPFLFALFLAKLLHPLIKKLHKRIKIKETVLSALLLILFFALVGFVLWYLGKSLVHQIQSLVADFPVYQKKAVVFWNGCCERLEVWTGMEAETLNGRVTKSIPDIWDNLKGTVLPVLMNETFSWVKGFFVLTGMVLIVGVSTLLILQEYDKMKHLLEKGMLGQTCLRILRRVYQAGGGYLKAQLIIMLLVSIVCVIGLFCTGNSYALLAGIGIGMCDALPFLGTGTVLIPWAILELLQGKYMLAAIYAVIYTIASLTREILEPKLVGDKLGAPPLAIIISVYVGLCIYGLGGVILGPLSYILIREIWQECFTEKGA